MNATMTRNRQGSAVRPIGKCTGCGADATHAYECATCHVVTLCTVVIKCAFPADALKSVTENFDDADLFAVRKDQAGPGNIRKIADIVIRLSTAHGLKVYDVKRNIVSRLRATCEGIDQETPEQAADMAAKIDDWLTALGAKIRE